MHASRSVASNPIVRFIADALRFYMEFHARWDGFYGAHLHDPMVVAAALDRALVGTQPVYLDVETGPGPADAKTVADFDGISGRSANADVAVDLDGPAILDRFIDRVGGLAASRYPPAPGAATMTRTGGQQGQP
jgi:purine nucleosidase